MLANGLKVIVAERHDTPTVVFDMVLDAGLASDQFAKPRAAQLTARHDFRWALKTERSAA